MTQLLKELGDFLQALFTPTNLTMVITISGILYKFLKKVNDNMESNQNKVIDEINIRLNELEEKTKESHDDINREILRLQILEGIESERLSRSELLYFFDKYKKLGGNSFVEDIANEYLSRVEH